MNDFTKEELKSLRASISATEISSSGEWGDKKTHENAKRLYNKIQSMIDNYCEHDDVAPSVTLKAMGRCKKCNSLCENNCNHKWLNMAYSYYQCEKCCKRKGINE